ncbi:hypothetical protein [Vibrio anguillarum]|uniref:hypothetical protein n=1 Tax=Vibrio anguillarum TaxID=55601 RepID=UPI00188CDD35|nr:hypothetical protein [Vibrio anguillarum]
MFFKKTNEIHRAGGLGCPNVVIEMPDCIAFKTADGILIEFKIMPPISAKRFTKHQV